MGCSIPPRWASVSPRDGSLGLLPFMYANKRYIDAAIIVSKAARNYPCDNFIHAFFGVEHSNVSAVGAAALQRQTWQCMIAQALAHKEYTEALRSMNTVMVQFWPVRNINLLVSPRICSRTLMGYSDPPSVFSRDGSLLPSIYADVRYIDDVIAIEGNTTRSGPPADGVL